MRLIFGILTCATLSAQLQESNGGGYIEKVFKEAGSVPRMGWFVPGKGFAAPSRSLRLSILGPLGVSAVVRSRKPLSRAAIEEIQKSYFQICELTPKDVPQVGLYAADSGDYPVRAFYLESNFKREISSGMVSVPSQLENVNRLFGWPDAGLLRRDETIAVRPDSYYYSIHRIFNRKNGLLTEEAIVLHDKDGQILAHEISKGIDTSDLCDSCRHSSFFSNQPGTFFSLNMFEI